MSLNYQGKIVLSVANVLRGFTENVATSPAILWMILQGCVAIFIEIYIHLQI